MSVLESDSYDGFTIFGCRQLRRLCHRQHRSQQYRGQSHCILPLAELTDRRPFYMPSSHCSVLSTQGQYFFHYCHLDFVKPQVATISSQPSDCQLAQPLATIMGYLQLVIQFH
jgi:hypothetical protein